MHRHRHGRRIDVLTRTPEAYGQALVDLGYQQGSCDQLFETLQFEGVVTFVTDPAEKVHALEVMVRQLEDDPESVIAAQTKERSVAKVTIGRIDLISLSGKRSAKVNVQL